MINNTVPIGVMDSGIGGLTVLEQLVKMFPQENFIYVADQGYCPYGPRSAEFVGQRVRKVTQYFVAQSVKAIVIACNTASLRINYAQEVTDIPVVSVIEPTCDCAIRTTVNNKVAVLATQGTINSGIYQCLLQGNGIQTQALACGEFVDFVENNDPADPRGEQLVRTKLASIVGSGIDTLIHGCTHFGLLEHQMRKVLGDINYISCGQPTGQYLKHLLEQRHLLAPGIANSVGNVTILTTGEASTAINSMKWFAVGHQPVQHIDIE